MILVVASNYQRFKFWLRQEEDKQKRSLRREYKYASNYQLLRGYRRGTKVIILDDGGNQMLMDELEYFQRTGQFIIEWIET